MESACSEQGARMSAMDSSSRNAGDMLDRLTLTYNRSLSLSLPFSFSLCMHTYSRNLTLPWKFSEGVMDGKYTQVIYRFGTIFCVCVCVCGGGDKTELIGLKYCFSSTSYTELLGFCFSFTYDGLKPSKFVLFLNLFSHN